MKKMRKTKKKVEIKNRYYHIGENDYVRVTAPLNILSTPYLEIWKARIGKTKASRVASKASARGSLIHRYCESICLGEVPDVKKKYKKQMEVFKEWFDENVEEVMLVEQMVYSDTYKLAGTPDLVAKLKGRKGIWVLDWKTGRIKPEHFLQLAAYATLVMECTDVKTVSGRLILGIRDNKVKEVEPKKKRIKPDFEIYMHVYTVWKWVHGNK